jgi:hypothetical protein
MTVAYLGHMYMCDRVTDDHGKCNLIYVHGMMCHILCVLRVSEEAHA